jgi:hypothetical protein
MRFIARMEGAGCDGQPDRVKPRVIDRFNVHPVSGNEIVTVFLAQDTSGKDSYGG